MGRSATEELAETLSIIDKYFNATDEARTRALNNAGWLEIPSGGKLDTVAANGMTYIRVARDENW